MCLLEKVFEFNHLFIVRYLNHATGKALCIPSQRFRLVVRDDVVEVHPCPFNRNHRDAIFAVSIHKDLVVVVSVVVDLWFIADDFKITKKPTAVNLYDSCETSLVTVAACHLKVDQDFVVRLVDVFQECLAEPWMTAVPCRTSSEGDVLSTPRLFKIQFLLLETWILAG